MNKQLSLIDDQDFRAGAKLADVLAEVEDPDFEKCMDNISRLPPDEWALVHGFKEEVKDARSRDLR